MENPELLNRVREALIAVPKVEEKKMFRGVTFMVDGKMCISVGDDELMCRVDPALHDSLIERVGCREMIHGGRTMKGFIFVEPEGYKNKADFDFWVGQCLSYNPKAKASKKK